MTTVLGSVFRVRPGEGERVSWMLVFSLAAVGGVVITGQLVGRTLFLSQLPPEAIPFRFVLPPLVLIGVIAAYTRLAARTSHTQLLRGAFLAMLAGTFVVRLLAASPVSSSFPFLLAQFVWFDVISSLTMVLFWTFAGDLFDAREAKRLFGIISGGSAIANVLFGAVLGQVALETAPEDLIFVTIASLTVCVGVVVFLQVRTRAGEGIEAPRPGAEQREKSFRSELASLVGTPLVTAIIGVGVVTALVSNIADYQLDLALKGHYAEDGRGMVRFLALFRLWAGVAATVVQFLLAGRLLERFGVLPALLVLPLTMAFGAGAILVTGGLLWAVVVPRASDVVLKYTVNDSAFNLLFLPLAPRVRARAKAVADGALKPLMVAALGLVFLFVSRTTEVSLATWSIPMLVLVLLWIALLFWTTRRYVSALADSITLRRLDLASEVIDLSDETSVRVVTEALQQPNGMRVIHTLGLIEDNTTTDWTPLVLPLLAHPSQEVRAEALRFLERRGDREHADRVGACMEDSDERVCEAALSAYARLLGTRAVARVTPFLADPRPPVRDGAIVALIRYGGLGGLLHAGRPLHDLLESQRAAEREEGARLLGLLGVKNFYEPLIDLLDDDDIRVRLAAVRASEEIATPELVPALTARLEEPRLRRPALEAIAGCAEDEVAALVSLARDASHSTAVRTIAVEMIARAAAGPGGRAAAELAPLVEDPDEGVRSAVYSALLEARNQGQEVPAERRDLLAALHEELQQAFARRLAARDVEEARDASPLLDEALEVATERDSERLLSLAALAHPTLELEALRNALDHADPRVRANAVELIDNVVDTDRDLLVSYVAGTEAEQRQVAFSRLGIASRPTQEVLVALLHDRAPWMRCCALDALVRIGGAHLDEHLREARADPDELVRDAAGAAVVGADGLPKLDSRWLGPLGKVQFLREVPLFGELLGEEVATVVSVAREVAFLKGHEIIRQGEVGEELYVIVEGRVAVEIDGRQLDDVATTLGVIGELAILSGDRRAATCTAATDVRALEFQRDEFWELLRGHPEIAIGVIETLMRYIET